MYQTEEQKIQEFLQKALDMLGLSELGFSTELASQCQDEAKALQIAEV